MITNQAYFLLKKVGGADKQCRCEMLTSFFHYLHKGKRFQKQMLDISVRLRDRTKHGGHESKCLHN